MPLTIVLALFFLAKPVEEVIIAPVTKMSEVLLKPGGTLVIQLFVATSYIVDGTVVPATATIFPLGIKALSPLDFKEEVMLLNLILPPLKDKESPSLTNWPLTFVSIFSHKLVGAGKFAVLPKLVAGLWVSRQG